MYILYTDKSEDFKCHIGVQGGDLDNTKARLVLENKNINLLFEGRISDDGHCIIPIKRLKGVLAEGETGNMKLEVITDDTFFSPWKDKFSVKTKKKIVVEVENDTTKNLLKEERIKVTVEKPKKTHSETITELLNYKGIKKSNIKEKIDIVTPLIEKYIQKFKVTTPPEELLKEVLNSLKK